MVQHGSTRRAAIVLLKQNAMCMRKHNTLREMRRAGCGKMDRLCPRGSGGAPKCGRRQCEKRQQTRPARKTPEADFRVKTSCLPGGLRSQADRLIQKAGAP